MDEEIKILRELCDEKLPREVRLTLLDNFAARSFSEPELQVVFDSIRALLARGPITASDLIVHLTRRGFPDVDVEKYIPVASDGS